MKNRSIVLPFALPLFCPWLYAQGEGWEPLFDDKDLSKWGVCGLPIDVEKQCWKVIDSAIVASTDGDTNHDHVWLPTEQEYQGFTLRLQFAAFRSSKGNSGLQLRSRYDRNSTWMDWPQIDMNPREPRRIGLLWDETRGVSRWIFPDLPKGKWATEDMAIGRPRLVFSDDSLL